MIRPALVLKWRDGDTCEAILVLQDYGFGLKLTKEVVIRPLNMNCDEMHDKDPIKRARAQQAKDYAIQLVPHGTYVMTDGSTVDDFGRFLASITLPDGRDFRDTMISKGLAVPAIYKDHECEVLS